MVRYYDIVIGLTLELGNLGLKLPGRKGEILMEECNAKVH